MQLKSSGGVISGDMNKTRLGQLFAYLVGHVLVAIAHKADLPKSLYGLYMEGSQVSM